MGKVVILEGPDGSGKTALAKEFERHGFIYKHEGPPQTTDTIAYYLDKLNESIEGDVPVVHDRLWLGERIYGLICRGNDTIGDVGQRLFDRLHNSKNIYHIVCLPPVATVIDNYSKKIKDPSDYVKSIEKMQSIYISYQRWVNHYSCIKYDYTKDSYKTWLELILSECFYPLPTGTIGSRLAKYLFIGDRPNHKTIDVPFFALTGSSGYLNSAIDFSFIGERNVAFSNAFTPDGKKHDLEEMVCPLKHLKKVILMGNAAQTWFHTSNGRKLMDALEFQAVSIPHPSYLKRFKGHNPAIMTGMINEAIKES